MAAPTTARSPFFWTKDDEGNPYCIGVISTKVVLEYYTDRTHMTQVKGGVKGDEVSEEVDGLGG